MQLILVGGAGEQRPPRVHFRHDAAGGPDIDAGVVRSAAEENVRGPVPERHDLVRKRVDGDAKGTGEAKIGQLQLALVVDQQILGFEVAVENSVLVAKGDPLQQLVHEGPDRDVVQLAAGAARVHVFLQIFIHILEHEHEFVLGVDDVMEGDDVLVLELFHQRNLTDGGRRRALLGIQMDLLEGHQLTRLTISPFKNLEPSG